MRGLISSSKGWEAVRVYREEGKSAHADAISKRPVFRQLLDDAASHSFDVVVVHTLDRWSRNMKVSFEALTILGNNNVGLVNPPRTPFREYAGSYSSILQRIPWDTR